MLSRARATLTEKKQASYIYIAVDRESERDRECASEGATSDRDYIPNSLSVEASFFLCRSIEFSRPRVRRVFDECLNVLCVCSVPEGQTCPGPRSEHEQLATASWAAAASADSQLVQLEIIRGTHHQRRVESDVPKQATS